MMATHNLSKSLNVFTPQAHKPTILNLHPNSVTIPSSSFSGGNWRVLRREMCLRDHLQPTETMGLSGPDPKVVASKRPVTRMRMRQNTIVPPWRSLTLEFLWDSTAPSEVLVAKKERLTPHLLDDAESEFKKILWQSVDGVKFEDLKTWARRMEISRKEDAAVAELLWYIRKPKGSHEIYEAKLLLVEMLIYQGEYERARETLEDVGRARATLEDVGKARETLEDVGKARATLEDVGKASATLEDVGKAKETLEDVGKAKATLEDVGKARETLEDVGKAKATLEDVGKAKETLEDVGKARATLEDVGKAKATLEDIGKARETLEDVGKAKATLEDVGKARATLEDVGKARETLEGVGKARETLEGVQLGPSDARLPFYQAVVYVLLGKNDKAEKNWDAFIARKFPQSPPKPADKQSKKPSDAPDESGSLKAPMAMAFSQFKRHVEVLRQEIVAVRCK